MRDNRKYIIWILTVLFWAVGGIGFLGGGVAGFATALGYSFKFLNSFELPLGHLEGIGIDSQGNIYCGLQFYSRIQAYDIRGNFKWGRFINSAGGAFRIRINENDQLEVATARNDKLYRFDNDGTLMRELSNVHHSYRDFGKSADTQYRVGTQNTTYVITTSLSGDCVARRNSAGEDKILITTPFHKWLLKGPSPAWWFCLIGTILLMVVRRDVLKRSAWRHFGGRRKKEQKTN